MMKVKNKTTLLNTLLRDKLGCYNNPQIMPYNTLIKQFAKPK